MDKVCFVCQTLFSFIQSKKINFLQITVRRVELQAVLKTKSNAWTMGEWASGLSSRMCESEWMVEKTLIEWEWLNGWENVDWVRVTEWLRKRWLSEGEWMIEETLIEWEWMRKWGRQGASEGENEFIGWLKQGNLHLNKADIFIT